MTPPAESLIGKGSVIDPPPEPPLVEPPPEPPVVEPPPQPPVVEPPPEPPVVEPPPEPPVVEPPGESPVTDVLVVDLLGGIGDLVMALPVIHGLAQRYPAARLRVVTHEPGAALLRGDPAVAEVRTPRHGGPGAERAAVAEAVARRRPDLAVTTTRYDGIPALLTATGARCVTDLWRNPPPDERVGERYLRILRAEGLGVVPRAPRIRLSERELRRGERALPGGRRPPPVVLVVGAGMAVKRWPTRRWRDLSASLRRTGHPVLTVAPPGAGAVRGGRLGGDLRDLAAAFAAVARRGGVVVGADTGPLRIAAAVGAATVGLFGPTDARRYGLTTPRSDVDRPASGVDIQGMPGCPHRRPTAITEQPCWWTAKCPVVRAAVRAARPACMADIGVPAVLAAVRSALRSTRRPVSRSAPRVSGPRRRFRGRSSRGSASTAPRRCSPSSSWPGRSRTPDRRSSPGCRCRGSPRS